MHKLLAICLLLLMATVPTPLRAQESQPSVEHNRPPSTLSGQGASLAFTSEGSSSNVSGGILFTTIFTDNADLLSNADKKSEIIHLAQPHVSLQQLRPRLDLSLDLGAGFIVSQKSSARNQATENAALNLRYRLTEQVSVRVADIFSNISGMFSGFNTPTTASGIGILEQPNGSLITPSAQVISNATLGEISYQPGPDSFVGLRGTYSIQRFPGSSQDVQFGSLSGNQSYAGEAFYDRRFSARHWAGVTLRAQRFDLQDSTAYTTAGSMLVFYAFSPNPHVTISVFAGPELYDTHLGVLNGVSSGTSFQGRALSSAEGATVNWQGRHTSAAVDAVRELNNGGGLGFSAVTLTSVTATLRRQLSKNQSIQGGLLWGQNAPLVSGNTLTSFSVRVDFEQQLGRRFMIQLGYARDRQDVSTSHNPAQANRSWVSLSYNFSRPLGR